ncbi:hypothetical protein DESUT3_02710 [Desulfuromonas versatilis]|uniref:Acyloxyacyl hydrolase n=1 Tax=Desulfuromonas versatilis TaxID=2802975 RepID=A0ABM8HNS0_9BACT|nr:acyloxyacyl hydrolase [Desulfuromonas versatilis]BCR03202.1 hypothetical protein DESUT3_02710 [Desulfuromonas versatilis]
MRRLFVWLLPLLLLPTLACGAQQTVATRYGLGGTLGVVYDPGADIEFVQLNGFALFDYDAIWPHRAPEPLRFKLEGNLGATTSPRTRALVSANMLALYFLDGFRGATFRPYAEAGIGLIYSDFRVKGQGLRVNFNPQAGLGAELDWGSGPPGYVAVRLHHVSNGGLHEDNRGLNSVLLQFGWFFP